MVGMFFVPGEASVTMPLPGEVYKGVPAGWTATTPPQSPRYRDSPVSGHGWHVTYHGGSMYEGKGGLVSNYNSLDNVPNWRRIGCQDPGHDNRALMPRSSSVPSLEEMPKPDREKIGALTNGNGAMLNVRNQKFNRLDKVYAERGRLSRRYLERVRQNDLEMLPKSVQHALYMRCQEDQDDTVQVVKEAMSRDAKEDFRSFKAPYNANRHQFAKPFDDTALRWKVIKALSR